MYDPVADSEEREREPLSPRIESLEGKRIGLFNNGKLAATPLLEVFRERLEAADLDATVKHYEVEHLNRIKNDDELASIRQWAEDEVDACFGAIGDCGSCTKFLVYGINAIEEGGTPAVGLIDEGFELDWQTNARDFGRNLRCYPLSRVAEVTNKERLRDELTRDVFEAAVTELTRPRTDEEKGVEEVTANGEQ